MVFACQKDSYLKQSSSQVVDCQSAKLKVGTEEVDGFEVVLDDTILFPEGGGQPDDRGTIDGEPVLRITRKETVAVHFVASEKPFEVGQKVAVSVDWDRRWDHMQQHTSQHLISALAEDLFQLKTTSWSLGETISTIEMDSPSISDETFIKLEDIVNQKIRESVPVVVKLYKRGDEELNSVRTRLELPDDQHNAPIRVVNIKDIDKNTCCGTHVDNLSHLQVVKLLSSERGKKNKTNVSFVAGNRLLKYLASCVAREKTLTASLKATPEQFGSMVGKLQKQLKLSQKNCLSAVRDLAVHEARRFIEMKEKPKFFSIHRKENEPDFITIFVKEVRETAKNTLLIISITDDATNPNGGGQVALTGDAELVERYNGLVSEMLGGKGIVKDGKFQAKVASLAKRTKLDEVIKQQMNIS